MALPTASDNPFPSFLAVETAAASISSPASGKQRLFIDTDHVLKYKNSGGTVANVGASSGGAKLYDYEVSGSDKLSVDTNVDGTTVANFTGYDVLEVFMYLRTDEAVLSSLVDVTFNNDTSAVYDRETFSAVDSSVSGGSAVAQTSLQCYQNGASRGANFFSLLNFVIPNYAGTVGYKSLTAYLSTPDSTAGNQGSWVIAGNYRSTSAITRIKVIPDTSGKKLKVGSRLLVYGR